MEKSKGLDDDGQVVSAAMGLVRAGRRRSWKGDEPMLLQRLEALVSFYFFKSDFSPLCVFKFDDPLHLKKLQDLVNLLLLQM